MATRGKVGVGDIVRIPLNDGTFGYGHVLDEPLVAFLKHRDSGEVRNFHELVERPVAFRIWVSNKPFKDRRWPVVGHVEPDAETLRPVPFFKQDAVSRKLAITYNGADELPATADDCRGMERAAVWEPEHVAERLLDYFEGRPNRWVESIRMKG